MRYSSIILQFTVAVLASVSCSNAEAVTKDKRQINHAGNVNTEEDRAVAETGIASAAVAGGKYFQYAHVPAKDHYEFGHRRGNEHHFNERHEKAHPHAGEFKTKVRWGDKHGGYGEHYWDYNHAGHGGHGEESHDEPQYAEYEATEEKPKYAEPLRNKREPNSNSQDVEFIDERARYLSEAGLTGRHGGNYRKLPGTERAKRNHEKLQISDFVYEPNSGTIINQKTGKAYELTLIP